MIYWLLFYEFFKIGLFAIGGGLVTVPFLFDLTARYDWFTTQELADMIAVSESTPGPLGVNMATYVGYSTAGIGGALAATVGLVAPSVIIIVMIAKLLRRFGSSSCLQDLLGGVRPAVLALILFAGIAIAKLAWVSCDLLPVLCPAQQIINGNSIEVCQRDKVAMIDFLIILFFITSKS